jgi:DNA polymerase-3 subunit alpha
VRTQLDRLSPQRDYQLIAGVIHSVRTQMTRRGKMAIIVLDDGHARVEVVVYNELFRMHSDWLKEDQLLIAEVTISNAMGNNGELRITADKLYNLATARSCYAKKIKLLINGALASDLANVARLKELLTPYRQDSLSKSKGAESHLYSYCPVSIIYRNQYAICEIELGDAWHVHLDDILIELLSTFLQTESIEIIY